MGRLSRWCLAISALMLVAGCDQYRDERERLQASLRDVTSQMAALDTQRAEAARALEEAARRRNELATELASAVSRQAQRAREHASYLADNKMAVAAVVAAAAAGGMLLDEDVAKFVRDVGGDGGAGLTLIAGVAGVVYCIANSDECSGVVSRMTGMASEKREAEQSVGKLRQLVATASEDIPTIEQKLSQVTRERASLDQRLTPIRSRLAQIQCNSLFC